MREGVQAALVDKNHSPKWDPPIVEAVSADQVRQVFELLDEKVDGWSEWSL